MKGPFIMNANALFQLLLPHFQGDIDTFKSTYKRAQLRSFIIPYEKVLELITEELDYLIPPGLSHCYCCPAKTEWLRVSRAMIRSYCEKHHPKPITQPKV
jgi:hypothetical protein